MLVKLKKKNGSLESLAPFWSTILALSSQDFALCKPHIWMTGFVVSQLHEQFVYEVRNVHRTHTPSNTPMSAAIAAAV